MYAFRRRLTGLIESGFDAELLRLDPPGMHVCFQCAEQHCAKVENATQTGASTDVRRNRFAPTLDAAMQAVVVAALVVRLMPLALDMAVCSDAENRVSPTPITAVIGKIVIYRQISPARREH